MIRASEKMIRPFKKGPLVDLKAAGYWGTFSNGHIIFSDARIIYHIKYRLDDACIRKDDTDT